MGQTHISTINKARRITLCLIPFACDFCLVNLLKGFAFFDQRHHLLVDDGEHFNIINQTLVIGNRPMTRDHNGVLVYLLQRLRAKLDETVELAAISSMDKGVTGIVVDIAQVNGVMPPKHHRRVTRRVGGAEVA